MRRARKPNRQPGGESQHLLHNLGNFEKSAVPSRFMFYSGGGWKDFPAKAFDVIKKGFSARHPAVQVEIDASHYLADFLRMLQIDLTAGTQRSIAWIDVNGACFFPKMLVDDEDAGVKPSSARVQGAGTNPGGAEVNQVADGSSSSTVPPRGATAATKNKYAPLAAQNVEEGGDETPGPVGKRVRLASTTAEEERAAAHTPSFDADRMKVIRLVEQTGAYVMVTNMFWRGMKKVDANVSVRAVRWCSNADPMGTARTQAFQRFAALTETLRGKGNIQYAWYGGDPMAIEHIVMHGFRQVDTRCFANAYGIGVYLSPDAYSYLSACHSSPDGRGDFHVLLCRVILGNMEKIQLGSQQFRPSNSLFDSGVDNLREPKCYIIWSTYMNTHVLPEYIVSFQVSRHLKELWRRRNMVRSQMARTTWQGSSRDISESVLGLARAGALQLPMEGQGEGVVPPYAKPTLSFPALFAALKHEIPPRSMEIIENLYNEVKVGKVGKEVLIRTVREIAGDEILREVINKISF